MALEQLERLWFGLGLGLSVHLTLWLTLIPVRVFWMGTLAAVRTLPQPNE